MTIVELEKSKVYVNPKNDIYKFKHPIDYIQPFVERFKDFNIEWDIKTDSRVINRDKDDSENTSYGRVAIIGTFEPKYNIDLGFSLFNEMKHKIGMVYALDTQKPEIKVSTGKEIKVCTNQCIFGGDNLTSVLLTSSNVDLLYDKTSFYIDNIEKENQKYIDIATRLYDTKLNKYEIQNHIGELFIYAKKNNKLGINPVSNALTYMLDEKSMYFVGENTNKWITYNAITEALKSSNIFDEMSKTLILEKVFLN